MKALVVEDQLMFCDLLAQACRNFLSKLDIVAVSTAEAARAILRQGDCLVLILDIYLPDANGFDFAEEVAETVPDVKIVGISAQCDAYTAYKLTRSPFAGFIDKSTQTVDELHHALDAIANGKKYFSPSVQAVREKLVHATDSFVKVLSSREIAILREVGNGKDDESIAQVFQIAAATVKWHRKQIMYKLGLHSHTDLVIYANLQGFSKFR